MPILVPQMVIKEGQSAGLMPSTSIYVSHSFGAGVMPSDGSTVGVVPSRNSHACAIAVEALEPGALNASMALFCNRVFGPIAFAQTGANLPTHAATSLPPVRMKPMKLES